MIYHGALLHIQAVCDRLAGAFPFLAEVHLPELSSGQGDRVAANWFFGMVLVWYALALGWAGIRRRSAWLSVLLTAVWLLPAFLAEIPVDWVWVAVLFAGWMASFLSGLMRRAGAAGRTRLQFVILPAGVFLLALIVLLFPAAEYRQPAWAGMAREQLMSWGTELADRFRRGAGDAMAGLTAEENETVDLAAAGPRQYTGITVLRVESDQPGTRYLRGQAYAAYTGQRWERLDDAALAALADALGEENMDMPLFFPAAVSAGRQTASLTISHVGRPSQVAYLPEQPASLPEPLQQAQWRGDAALVWTDTQRNYTIRYFSAQPEPIPEDSPAAPLEEQYRQFVHQFYLAVPEETAEQLRRWRSQAEQMDGTAVLPTAPGPYQSILDEAGQIARLLAANTEYDLQTPYMPADEDFAVYFLTASRRGYCMHYASAATLLLRLEGIPARYVSGYRAEIPETGTASVPDSAAHAWVEVYLDGYGWYPVEVTPAAAFSEGNVSDEVNGTEPTAPEQSPNQGQETENQPANPWKRHRHMRGPRWNRRTGRGGFWRP